MLMIHAYNRIYHLITLKCYQKETLNVYTIWNKFLCLRVMSKTRELMTLRRIGRYHLFNNSVQRYCVLPFYYVLNVYYRLIQFKKIKNMYFLCFDVLRLIYEHENIMIYSFTTRACEECWTVYKKVHWHKSSLYQLKIVLFFTRIKS